MIIKKINLVLASIMIMLLGLFAMPLQPAASAYNPLDEACKNIEGANNPEDSAACRDSKSTNNPVTGKDGVILRVTTIIASIAGIVAVIMIIIAGAKMITSGGDANAVKESRGKLLHAVIGLVIIVLAQSIVALVITKLL